MLKTTAADHSTTGNFFPPKGKSFASYFTQQRSRSWELGEEQGYRHSKLKYPDRVRANKTFYIIL